MEFFKFEKIKGTNLAGEPLYRLYVDGKQVGDVWTMDEILKWTEDKYQRESLPRSDR